MAVSHMFLSTIVVIAAFLGIDSAHNTWVEGTIFCVRNGKWSPLKGATARVLCLAFEEGAVTNENGYFLKKLQENTDICLVSLENPGRNSGDCVVPNLKETFTFVKKKYKDTNDTIFTATPLTYNPLPSAATPPNSIAPPTSFANNLSIPSVKQP